MANINPFISYLRGNGFNSTQFHNCEYYELDVLHRILPHIVNLTSKCKCTPCNEIFQEKGRNSAYKTLLYYGRALDPINVHSKFEDDPGDCLPYRTVETAGRA